MDADDTNFFLCDVKMQKTTVRISVVLMMAVLINIAVVLGAAILSSASRAHSTLTLKSSTMTSVSLRLRGGAWEVEDESINSGDEYSDEFPSLAKAAALRDQCELGDGQSTNELEDQLVNSETYDDESAENGVEAVRTLWDVKQGEGLGLWSGFHYMVLRNRRSGVVLEFAQDASTLSFIFCTHTGSEVRAYQGSGTQDSIAFVPSERCPRLLRALAAAPGDHTLSHALTPHASAASSRATRATSAQQHVFGMQDARARGRARGPKGDAQRAGVGGQANGDIKTQESAEKKEKKEDEGKRCDASAADDCKEREQGGGGGSASPGQLEKEMAGGKGGGGWVVFGRWRIETIGKGQQVLNLLALLVEKYKIRTQRRARRDSACS
jgi:hypothetical protein